MPPTVATVLVGPASGRFPSLVFDRDLVDMHLRIRGPGKGRYRRLGRISAAIRLLVWVLPRRRRILALHANGPEELNIVLPASLLTRVPVVVWSHAGKTSPWMHRLSPILRRVTGRVTWTAVSIYAAQVLEEAGLTSTESVRIIPDPIDPEDVVGSQGPLSDRVVIGYLGSDHSYKGFDILPEVIERAGDLPIHWMIFSEERHGSQETWRRLRAMPRDRVTVPGRLADVSRAYSSCDLVFCPSFVESFGRVVAEAMLNQIPVVASDLPPIRDLVGSEAGILFRPGDVGGAVASIRRLVMDRGTRMQMGREGRARAAEFDPVRVATALLEVYGWKGQDSVSEKTGNDPRCRDRRGLLASTPPHE